MSRALRHTLFVGLTLALAALGAPRPAAAAGAVQLQASSGGASGALDFVVDELAPTVTILSPSVSTSLAASVAGSAVTVTGTVTDQVGLGVLDPAASALFGTVAYRVIDGVTFATLAQGRAPLVDGRFSIPDVPLGAGSNLIDVSAMDAAGNVGTGQIVVESSPATPPAALVGPQDGSAIVASSTSIDLNLAEPMTLVSVNGVADGRALPAGFSAGVLDLPLALGPNSFVLEFEGSAGSFTLSFTLFRVESLGPIRITEPADGSTTNQTTVTVQGTVPLGTPYVEVNGVPATIAPDLVTFTAQVPLAEGTNQILARAYPFGQTDTVQISVDSQAPRFVTVAPGDGSLSLDPTVSLAGTVSEAAQVEAVGPGGTVTVPTQARLLGTVPTGFGTRSVFEFTFALPPLDLVDGANPIELRLTDAAGNTTTQMLTINRAEPALALVDPPDGSSVSALHADLTLQALADVTIDAVYSGAVRLPGFEGQPLAAGSATLPDIPLAPGANPLRIVYHRAGEATETLAATLTSTATDAAHVEGTVTDAQTGDPLDGALVTIAATGLFRVVATGADGRFSAAVEPGPVQAVVTNEGFLQASFSGTVAAGDTLTETASLSPVSGGPSPPQTLTLVGTVTSGLTGAAEPNVTVSVLSTDLTATTDASGAYVLAGVPTGVQTLRLQEEGFVDEFVTFTANPDPDGYPVERDFEFPHERGVSGTLAISPNAEGVITDALTGEPIEGAAVRAGGLSAASGSDGRFSFAGLPIGPVEVVASRPGFADETRSGVVVENGPDRLEIGLVSLERGEVAGTITDASSGKPVRFAEVDMEKSPVLAAATISDGSYRLVRVSPGTYDLTIRHPGYETTVVPGVIVQADQVTPLDVALTPLPHTGSLKGVVTDADTGEPIGGATLTVAGAGVSTRTAPDGSYTLSDLPAGLATIDIDAPPRAPTKRTTAVVADVDASTPTVTEADFVLDAAGTRPVSVTKTIVASQGGSIATPDGRFQFEILANSLTGDAKVTLTPPETPLTSNGDLLTMDPALGAPEIAAVGGEVLLQVRPLVSGDPVPRLVGPVVIVMRYSAADAASANVVEDSLAPYFFDGTNWTVLHAIPHVHAVDQVNKIAIMGQIFNETETNEPTQASLRTATPILLAQASGDPPTVGDVLREFRLRLAGALKVLGPPLVNVKVTDIIAEDPSVDPAFADAILPDAFPLLIFSGWDWKTVLFNVQPSTRPFSDPRYRQMIPDLYSAIDGVYRPFYVANNSRAPLKATGNAVSGEIDDHLKDFKKRFFKEPEQVGVNAFSFSQGTIVARSYQAQDRAQGDLGGSVGPLRDAVFMAGMHHGAIQGLEAVLDSIPVSIGEIPLPVTIMDLIRTWSPGTADLLDYDDRTGAGNPYLFDLNRDPFSTADERNVLIAGTDRRLYLPFFPDVPDAIAAEAGDLVVGSTNGRHDSAIPVFSALGRRKLGDAPPTEDVPSVSLPFFRSALRSTHFFNHNAAGMVVRNEDQTIKPYARNDITNNLFGWATFRVDPLTLLCPTPGNLSFPPTIIDRAIVRWNTPHDEATGAALIVYELDQNGNWHIVHGADPETGALHAPCTDQQKEDCPVVSFDGSQNSRDRRNKDPNKSDLEMKLDFTLPKFDPQDPTTRVRGVVAVAVAIGGQSQFQDSVPLDPEDFPFFDSNVLLYYCPCPDPEAPACQ